uniref:Matrix remodeling associated 5 n=1 Tax=Pavo cristatus TaxID=9049 RepID=A0A8C9FGD0_PAVCR
DHLIVLTTALLLCFHIVGLLLLFFPSAGEDRKVVWIHVNVQPPRINGHLNAITSVRETAIRDSRKLIDCKAEEGVILPAPYYGNRITVHRNGTLDIRGVRQTDAVQLVCIGRNEGGEARLIVQLVITDHLEKPSFRDPVNERITAIAGHSINLNCSVQGYPEPTTSWILPNGTEFVNGNLFVFPNGTLYIRNVSPKDSGIYECIAANMVGAARRIIQLHVKKQASNAKITGSSPQRTDVTYGSILHLDCSASGDPWPRILWRLPSKRMIDSLHR